MELIRREGATMMLGLQVVKSVELPKLERKMTRQEYESRLEQIRLLPRWERGNARVVLVDEIERRGLEG
jgi:hypothetical protein